MSCLTPLTFSAPERVVLDSFGVKMFLGSIGTKERGLEFVEKTGFPSDRLLADPEGQMYIPLNMKKGVNITFFSKDTPYAIWDAMKSGKIEYLKDVMKVWTKTPLWIPPKQDQAFQQGGVAVFKGSKLVWIHRDTATGAHADFSTVIDVATKDLKI